MPRNIVLCCDGTSNDVTCDSTNVLRLYRSLVRDQGQLTYYDSGVGTISDPSRWTSSGLRLSRALDMAAGKSVRDNVCRAYGFLSRHYEPGDSIYLLGFSRGAYAVRALAGMIHFLGLTRPELEGLDQLAWAVYADPTSRLSTSKRFSSGSRFRNAFGLADKVRIHFVGVWDTVSSFGWIWDPRTLPHTANNPSIDHIRHAVSIDERRACFRANLFRPEDPHQHLSMKEVWFAGSHGDVGGGYPEEDSGLAKISLQWMYQESGSLGLRLDQSKCDYFLGQSSQGSKCPPNPSATVHESTRGLWHLLEFFPRKCWDSRTGSNDATWHRPNFYRRRFMPNYSVLHESVLEKLRSDSQYRPSNLPKLPDNNPS